MGEPALLFLIACGLQDMADPSKPGWRRRFGLGHGVKLDNPDAVRIGFFVEETHDTAMNSLDHRDVQFAGANELGEDRCRATSRE